MDNTNEQPLKPSTNDRKEYMKAYYEKRKVDYYTEVLECKLCGGQYRRSNKSHHYNSRRHKDLVEYNDMKKKLEALKNN